MFKNLGMKVDEVDGWSHSDRFTTGEKSPGTLDRKKRGPQCGVGGSVENFYAPGGSRSPAVHLVASHLPNNFWAAVIRSTH